MEESESTLQKSLGMESGFTHLKSPLGRCVASPSHRDFCRRSIGGSPSVDGVVVGRMRVVGLSVPKTALANPTAHSQFDEIDYIWISEESQLFLRMPQHHIPVETRRGAV